VEICIANIWHLCVTSKAKYEVNISGRKSNDRFDSDVHCCTPSWQHEGNGRVFRGSLVFLPFVFNLRKRKTDFDKIWYLRPGTTVYKLLYEAVDAGCRDKIKYS
jgi:hypothetical protein